jgi:hypothetical protein
MISDSLPALSQENHGRGVERASMRWSGPDAY